MAGEVAKFSVVDWGSRKLRRVARSSQSAEVQEAGVAEGGVQVGELLPGPAVHVRIPRRHLVLPE